MELVIGFASTLGGIVLLTSAVSGATLTDVITGKAGQIYRQNQTAAGTSSSPAAVTDSTGSIGATPAGGFTRETWAHALLAGLGVPATAQAITNVVAWETQEGGAGPQFGVSGNTANFNPLNTSQTAAGASTINSDGVKSYSSWATGLAATVQTLHNGLYPGILAALSSPTDQFKAAVNSSPWGTVF